MPGRRKKTILSYGGWRRLREKKKRLNLGGYDCEFDLRGSLGKLTKEVSELRPHFVRAQLRLYRQEMIESEVGLLNQISPEEKKAYFWHGLLRVSGAASENRERLMWLVFKTQTLYSPHLLEDSEDEWEEDIEDDME
jgi:hypothetical protein